MMGKGGNSGVVGVTWILRREETSGIGKLLEEEVDVEVEYGGSGESNFAWTT